ncbi:MAG: succinate dehydrogenase assembly factor 2 [Hyphomicrobium sp.]
MTDDVDMRRRRALYRAMHRGTKEMDYLMGRFAGVHVPGMGLEALDHFERFLNLPDPLLQGWVLEAAAEPPPEFGDLVKHVRRFHGLEDQGQANG